MPARRFPAWIRTFLAIALTITPPQFSFATFDFMVLALQRDLGLSIDQSNAVQIVPTAGALLTVFLAGRLDDVFGSRRVILGGSALFCLGAIVSASAKVLAMIVLGRALEGIGGATMSIAALALLGRTFSDHPHRGMVYGVYAAIAPAIFVFAPFLAAHLARHGSWRIVPILWAVAGGLSAVGALVLLPRTETGYPPLRSLATPLLGGLAVALACSAVMAIAGIGTPAQAGLLIVLALAICAPLVLALLRRTGGGKRRLSLRWTPLIAGLSAQLLMRLIDMPFFTTILLQHRFGFGLGESAWLMLPCQIASVAGGIAGGRLMDRHGARLAAIFALAFTAAAALATLFLRTQSPPWMAIVSVSLIGAANMSALAALTAHIMDSAGRGAEGSAASFLNVAENVGIVVGGVLAGLAVFRTFESSFALHLDQFSSLSTESARSIAAQIRAGVTLDRLMGRFEVAPLELGALVSIDGPAFAPAWTAAYRIAAAICLASNAAAAIALLRWRRSTPRGSS
jgi:MFS family permease